MRIAVHFLSDFMFPIGILVRKMFTLQKVFGTKKHFPVRNRSDWIFCFCTWFTFADGEYDVRESTIEECNVKIIMHEPPCVSNNINIAGN